MLTEGWDHGYKWRNRAILLANEYSELAPGVETMQFEPTKTLTIEERNRLRSIRHKNTELPYVAFCSNGHEDDYSSQPGRPNFSRFCFQCKEKNEISLLEWRIR